MTSAPVELARVREKFAPLGVGSFLGWSALLIAMLVASHFKHVDWYFFAGMLSAATTWEITKWRLRKNTENFASGSGSR